MRIVSESKYRQAQRVFLETYSAPGNSVLSDIHTIRSKVNSPLRVISQKCIPIRSCGVHVPDKVVRDRKAISGNMDSWVTDCSPRKLLLSDQYEVHQGCEWKSFLLRTYCEGIPTLEHLQVPRLITRHERCPICYLCTYPQKPPLERFLGSLLWSQYIILSLSLVNPPIDSYFPSEPLTNMKPPPPIPLCCIPSMIRKASITHKLDLTYHPHTECRSNHSIGSIPLVK